MPIDIESFKPDAKAVYFMPLGGTGEFGMNASLYGHDGKWLLVDCGMGFGDDSTPGVDTVLPDLRYAAERRESIVGLVITHAHEDHIGAVGQLWQQLRCPVYVTPFAAALLEGKLSEAGIKHEVPVNILKPGSRFNLAPFNCEFVPMTHSVPEAQALLITTPVGRVLHTGDWKLDPAPVVGPLSAIGRLIELGEDGVDALIGDSTNAMVQGHSGSEAELEAEFRRVIADAPNRVAATLFSSNVARMVTIARAAAAADRQVVMVGRSVTRNAEAARNLGYLEGIAPFVSERDAGFLPRDKVLYIVSGSQGEPRSAMSRIARQEHPEIDFERGDLVLFSARPIPGNEAGIIKVQDQLVRRGIGVVTPSELPIHVSGHACRDELAQMYHWVRPRLVVPVHGQAVNMFENARLAESCQVPSTYVPENGQLIRLFPGKAELLGTIDIEPRVTEGRRLIPLRGEALRERQRLMHNGSISIVLVLDRDDRAVADPAVIVQGVVENDIAGELAEALGSQALRIAQTGRAVDDDALIQSIRTSLRKQISTAYNRRPPIEIRIIRV